jgi:glycosyltransferase involved in cell wall biosynthesis
VEGYIAECLNSVLNQTHLEIEIICVDDGSTDGTFKILNEYAVKVPSKIKIIQQENKGAPSARNKGLSVAKGEWVQFLDADDLLLPDKIEHQINLIPAHSGNIGFIVGSDIKKIINGKTNFSFPEKDFVVGLLFSNLGNTCANLFSAIYVGKVNGWNEKIKSSQEYDLMFRIIKQGGTIITDKIPKTVVRERKQGQISTADVKNNRIRFSYLRIEMANYFQEKYGLKYKKQIQLALFETFKNLSNYDLNLAIDLYKKHLPPRLNINSTTNTTFIYRCFYYIIGFRFAELLKRRIPKITLSL